jgi:outer membrane protein OmpA-like peptidoglycan-associated protein
MPCGRWFGLACFLAGTIGFGSSGSAQERMQLGAPDVMAAGIGRDFRMSVGDRVFFADRSAELSARARAAIEAQAQWLKRKPGLIIIVEGHADDSGTSDDNMALSRQRGDAVRQRLIELGVATDRIRVSAFGRDQTVADCTGSQCAAQNRRAVTVVRPGAPAPAAAPGVARKAEGVGGPGAAQGRQPTAQVF